MRKFILFIISIFCVAILCVIFYNFYTSNDDSMTKRVNKGSPLDSVNEIIAMELPNPGHRQDFIYPSDNIRDPFQVRHNTIVTTQQKPPLLTGKPIALRLTGVIWKDDKAIAIIKDSNNQTHLAKAGEKIDSFRVIDIKPRMVKVQEIMR